MYYAVKKIYLTKLYLWANVYFKRNTDLGISLINLFSNYILKYLHCVTNQDKTAAQSKNTIQHKITLEKPIQHKMQNLLVCVG